MHHPFLSIVSGNSNLGLADRRLPFNFLACPPWCCRKKNIVFSNHVSLSTSSSKGRKDVVLICFVLVSIVIYISSYQQVEVFYNHIVSLGFELYWSPSKYVPQRHWFLAIRLLCKLWSWRTQHYQRCVHHYELLQEATKYGLEFSEAILLNQTDLKVLVKSDFALVIPLHTNSD